MAKILPQESFNWLFSNPVRRFLKSAGLFLLLSNQMAAALDGTFYFSWGYNRESYSRSDIHYKSSDGDSIFVIKKARALDRPNFKAILSGALTVPQYNWRLGYFFNDKNDLGIELNFDHTKYVMVNNQTLHVSGTLNGVEHDEAMLVDFLKFEHTNGANFFMLNGLKRWRHLDSPSLNHRFSTILRAGAGIVIPKTDSTFFGERVDAPFHISGYLLGLETSLRYEFFKYGFSELAAKCAFANYNDVLVATGKAHHTFWTVEGIFSLGAQF